MSSHLFPELEPPLWWHVLLRHAAELAIAGFCALAGILVVTNAHQIGETYSLTPLVLLPTFLVYGIGAFVGAGGLVTSYGVLVRKSNLRTELNIEQTGWILIVVGWSGYLWAAIVYAEGSTLSVILSAFLIAGGILRATALFLIERKLEVVQEEVNEQHKLEGETDAA